MYRYMHVCTCACVYMQGNVHAYQCFVIVCTCVPLHMHVCILVHVHTCMFTDTRTVMQHSPEEKENEIRELIDLSLNQLCHPRPSSLVFPVPVAMMLGIQRPVGVSHQVAPAGPWVHHYHQHVQVLQGAISFAFLTLHLS